MKKICVIGGGRWGQNHIRTLAAMGNLAAVVESDTSRLENVLKNHPTIEGYAELDQAIDARYDGYIVATPAETHYAIAKKLLANRLNVLVEKPMTLYSEQAKELVEMAHAAGVSLMVGHILLFHTAIRKIKEVIDSGLIGKLNYLYSTRLNLGTVRTEENVFWSFAPHDISVLDYLIGNNAIRIEAKGSKFLQNNIYDITLTQFEYPNNVHAHIFVSWLHPFKEQRLVVVGDKGMLSFDDSTDKNIYFYNKQIKFDNGTPVKLENPDEIIPYDRGQPLEAELRYFIDNPDGRVQIATGQSGYEVVRILENVQNTLDYNS